MSRLFILFFICYGYIVADSHRSNHAVQVIYVTVEPSQEWIFGNFEPPKNEKGAWHVFLIPLQHELSWKSSGLISFHHRVEVLNRQFEFRYASAGEWILGAFLDLNRNTLLDLDTEPFYIYEGSPISLRKESVSVEFIPAKQKRHSFILKNFPEEYPWLVRLSDKQKRPLFVRPFDLPKLVISGISPPFYLSFAEDINEDGVLDIKELSTETYLVDRNFSLERTIFYGEAWHPLEFQVEKPLDLDIHLLSKHHKDNFRQNLMLMEDNTFYHYNLPTNEYQLELLSATGNLFHSSSFYHPTTENLEFAFSTDYVFFCQAENLASHVLMQYENNPAQHFFSADFCNHSVFQAGNYRLTFYDYFPDHDDKSLLWQNVDIYHTHLTADQKSAYLNDLIPENKKNQKFQAKYRFGSEKLPSAAVLYFFQHLAQNEEPLEILFALPLNRPIPFSSVLSDSEQVGIDDYGSDYLLDVYFSFDHRRDLFSFVDFNANSFLDFEERAFVSVYRNIEHTAAVIEFPILNIGSLDIFFLGPAPERHFLEIYLVAESVSEEKAEDLKNSSDKLLSAAFLSSHAVFDKLPQLFSLRLRLVFDVNNNGVFDAEDVFYPEQEVLIPWRPAILPIVLRVAEKNLFIETKLE